MSKRTLIILLCTLSASLMAANGNDSIARLTERVNKFNAIYPQEKVYLHLDNTGYFMDETLWMKAYLTRTDGDTLGSLSRVLYVELVSPFGDVVKTEKLRVINGCAYGQMPLDQLMTSGYYELRAYTRYMLNWGKDAIFSRVIPIFNAPEKAGDYTHPRIDESVSGRFMPDNREEATDKRHSLNVKFYPEGGALVRGLRSRVAFEVTSEEGYALEAEGRLTGSRQTGTTVKTTWQGRGVVEVTPDGSRQTFEVMAANGKKGAFELPEAMTSGCVMTADNSADSLLSIRIEGTPGLGGMPMGLTFMHQGRVYDCRTFSLGAAPVTLRIDRRQMKEGVNVLTLIDGQGRIQASRLVFIYPRQALSDIRITATDSTKGVSRIIGLDVNTLPHTTFSMSITDAAMQTGGAYGNAATWMLLTSDLRGYIHQPEYYLESDDEAHRRAADLLMMVQGWCRYDFRTMAGKAPFKKMYPVENRLYIDGQLYKYRRRKNLDNINLTVTLHNALGDLLRGQTTTEQGGHYVFALPDCYRSWTMQMVTTKDHKYERYYVGINRHFSPEARQLSPYELRPIELPEPQFMLSRQQSADNDSLTAYDGSNLLRTVVVKGKKWKNPRAFWEREERGQANSTIMYDCEKEVDEYLDRGQEAPSLIGFLKERNSLFVGNDNLSGCYNQRNPAANIHADGPQYARRPIAWIVNNRFMGVTGAPRHLSVRESEEPQEPGMDYFPASLDETRSVYISLKKGDWRRFAPYTDIIGDQWVTVFVYTNSLAGAKRQKGIRFTHFEGFNVAEDHYQTVVKATDPLNDHRRTLYWNPNVTTDAEGKAHIAFAGNQTMRQMYVSAEGITKDGRAMVNLNR